MTMPTLDLHSDRVLLVDDDEGIRRAFQRVARQGGFVADTAPDCLTAITMCQTHRYGVIALDYAMPIMTGFDVHDELRMVAPDATFGLISAQCDLDLAMAATNDHGFRFVLTKPWHTAELVSVLRRAMEEWWERSTYRKLEQHAMQRQAAPAPAAAGRVVDTIVSVLRPQSPRAIQRGFRMRGIAHVTCQRLGLPLQLTAEISAAAFVRGALHPSGRYGPSPGSAPKPRKDDASVFRVLSELIAHSTLAPILVALEQPQQPGAKEPAERHDTRVGARVVRAVEAFDDVLTAFAGTPQEAVCRAITTVSADGQLDSTVVSALVTADRNTLEAIADDHRNRIIELHARIA